MVRRRGLPRGAVLVVLAIVATSCAFIRPGPGGKPGLILSVSPPGAGGAQVLDVTAPSAPGGLAAGIEVHADLPGGPIVASGSALPLHVNLDDRALRRGPHVLFATARPTQQRPLRGLGVFTKALRLNQLQAVGTHNSYHVTPTEEPWASVEPWQVTMSPLATQLEDEGVRQFELDVNTGPGGFAVFHVPVVDPLTTCLALTDCLRAINDWSNAHPSHAPIAVLLELKDNDLHFDVPYGFWGAPDLEKLDTEIRSVFSERHMFTPDDLRRAHATLPEAIAADGWPTIDSVRGQVMFLMDNSGTLRNQYRAGHPGLQGRVIFTNAVPGDDDAAFIKRNDPLTQSAEIQSLVAQGYVVRTRTDVDAVEARANDTHQRDVALATGAQWVSTDFPVAGRAFGTPYFVALPGGTPDRCNPINAPTWCTSRLIEALP